MSWGFRINPYDQCVANKQINVKQCTIVWHVDNLKILHVSESVLEGIIQCLNKSFKGNPLATSRGKVLEYLGLTLDYSLQGNERISMYDYMRKIVEEAREDMQGVSKTTAGNHLFMTNPDCDKLLEKTAQIFYHIIAKLLYLCRRTRQDIQTAVAFL